MNYYSIVNSLQWSNYEPLSRQSDQNYFFRIAGGIPVLPVIPEENNIPDGPERRKLCFSDFRRGSGRCQVMIRPQNPVDVPVSRDFRVVLIRFTKLPGSSTDACQPVDQFPVQLFIPLFLQKRNGLFVFLQILLHAAEFLFEEADSFLNLKPCPVVEYRRGVLQLRAVIIQLDPDIFKILPGFFVIAFCLFNFSQYRFQFLMVPPEPAFQLFRPLFVLPEFRFCFSVPFDDPVHFPPDLFVSEPQYFPEGIILLDLLRKLLQFLLPVYFHIRHQENQISLPVFRLDIQDLVRVFLRFIPLFVFQEQDSPLQQAFRRRKSRGGRRKQRRRPTEDRTRLERVFIAEKRDFGFLFPGRHLPLFTAIRTDIVGTAVRDFRVSPAYPALDNHFCYSSSTGSDPGSCLVSRPLSLRSGLSFLWVLPALRLRPVRFPNGYSL